MFGKTLIAAAAAVGLMSTGAIAAPDKGTQTTKSQKMKRNSGNAAQSDAIRRLNEQQLASMDAPGAMGTPGSTGANTAAGMPNSTGSTMPMPQNTPGSMSNPPSNPTSQGMNSTTPQGTYGASQAPGTMSPTDPAATGSTPMPGSVVTPSANTPSTPPR